MTYKKEIEILDLQIELEDCLKNNRDTQIKYQKNDVDYLFKLKYERWLDGLH